MAVSVFRDWMKNDTVSLAILILVSLLLSAYLFFHTYVIALDGAFQYIPLAKAFASGAFREALGTTGQQPLYPLLIALFSLFIPNLETAGKLVASLSGILLIFPVYFLGKRLVHQRVAFFSTLLLVLHPYFRRFSADVLKESTYLFFLALALWFTWKTIQKNEKFSYLLIPIWSLLAYFVRPDGAEIFLVAFFYILLVKPFQKQRERWIALSLLSLSTILLALPYFLYLREITGVWTLSKTKTFLGLFGLEGWRDSIPLLDKTLFALKRLYQEILSVYHPFYLFLLVIGGLKRKSNHLKEGDGFLLTFLIGHSILLFLLALNTTEWGGKDEVQAFQFSGRHVLPLLLFSIYWVGIGFETVSDGLMSKIESNRFLSNWTSKAKTTFLWTFFFVIVAAILLPKTLKPQRYERLPEKWAGIWMKQQLGVDQTIFTTIPRVAYYADGKFERIDLEKGKIEKMIRSMRERQALYLVLRERDTIQDPEIIRAIKKEFIELARFEGRRMDRVIVYQRTY